MTDLDIIKRLEQKIGREILRQDMLVRGSIGYSLDGNQHVTKLSLLHCGLTDFPEEILDLKNLDTLDLSQNQLTTLPDVVGKLTNLGMLDLSSNHLTTFPAVISKLSRLRLLYLSNNRLRELPDSIERLTNLQSLNISSNKLAVLPESVSKLSNLEALGISENHLTELPTSLGKLTNLVTLFLSDNLLTALPETIGKLKNLVWLSLSDNLLTTLPEVIGDLKFLQDIDLSLNQLTTPPQEIAEKGIEAIREWFKTQHEEQRPLNELKVVFVGDGGAGKTSLMNQLLNVDFNPQESQTHGININSWNVDDVHVNLWDFGGQVIMHATHQFFLSRRSLYVLVLNSREDPQTEGWLKLIESFAGNSPIMVVINKIDENPAFDVNRKFLQEKYPAITGFHRLSCSSGNGVAEFEMELGRQINAVQHIRETWGKSWFDVKNSLENLRLTASDFISVNEYEDICNKAGITSEAARTTLVDFLNDLGVVIHFPDFKLNDFHVINPEWATGGVYRIINSTELAHCNGILKISQLKTILKKQTDGDLSYPLGTHKYIIELMRKFQLCYPIDDDHELVPDLLGIQEPLFAFDYGSCVRFRFDYEDYLPKSVMPRFIVKMHKDIKLEGFERLQWRTGVVLEDKNFQSVAVVKSDEDARRIYIYVSGKQKRDYLSVILFQLRDVNSSFKGFVKELVCLPDQQELTMAYEDLIFLESEGERYCIPPGAKKRYEVQELLGLVYNDKISRKEVERILSKMIEDSDDEKSFLERVRKRARDQMGELSRSITAEVVVEIAKVVWAAYAATRVIGAV